jgi:membrane protein
MSALMNTLNAVHQVEEGRSFIRRNATAVALTAAVALVMLAAIVILLAAGPAAQAFSRGWTVALLKIVQWPIAIALVLFGFALLYYFAPDIKDQEWHWLTPGAIAGLVSWLVVSIGLKIYLHFFNTYSRTYGSLGAVIVLLLWFYLTGAAVLMGAELNSVLENAAAEAGAPAAKLKGEKAPGEADPRGKRTPEAREESPRRRDVA